MRASIVPIGNSRGVRIPKTFLQICHIGKEVEMELDGDTILLRPVGRKPRAGWEKKLKIMHARGEDKPVIDDLLDLDMVDWEW